MVSLSQRDMASACKVEAAPFSYLLEVRVVLWRGGVGLSNFERGECEQREDARDNPEANYDLCFCHTTMLEGMMYWGSV